MASTPYDAHGLLIQAAILLPLCILAVSLRFWARALSEAYGWDDLFALMGLIFFIGYEVVVIISSSKGDPLALPVPEVESYLKLIYWGELLVPPCMAAAKFSVLFLYSRIFQVDQTLRISLKILGLLNLLGCLVGVIGLAFKCVPVHKSWNPSIPGFCLNFPLFTLLIETPNSLCDFVMIVIPMSALRGIQMLGSTKLYLTFIFFLGGFVGVIGFLRIGILYHPSHWTYGAVAWWVGLELAAGILCCSLPVYRPLFKNLQIPTYLRSHYASFMRKESNATYFDSSPSNLPSSHLSPRWQQGPGGYNEFDGSGEADNGGWMLSKAVACVDVPLNDEAKRIGSCSLDTINVGRDV